MVKLPDGRRLAFVEHGDSADQAVLLCYGTPSSRLVEPHHATLADELSFRLIVADRLGSAAPTRSRGEPCVTGPRTQHAC